MAQLPTMYRVRQSFPRPRVDAAEAARTAFARLGLGALGVRGKRIGVGVGSRGIRDLAPVVKAVVDGLRGLGAEPRLLAAMGSHGGGTEEGQRELLASYGITEEAMGAPVVTCVEAERVATSAAGVPLHTLRSALEVDGIVLVNRVKTHTSFKGSVESGLAKMLVVGMGGPQGAQTFHGLGAAELPGRLLELTTAALARLPVLGGIAIVENAYEETARVEAVSRERFLADEAALLEASKALLPALPADRLDLLVVGEMGKNFSGTGMDTNVIGRARIHGVAEPERPAIARIAVLDLTEESHGNATGLGLADFTTRRLVDKVDRQKTYLNCLTSTFVSRAFFPLWFDTERELVDAALFSLSGVPRERLRVLAIPNTLFLTDLLASEALLPELRARPGVEADEAPVAMGYDADGRLTPRP